MIVPGRIKIAFRHHTNAAAPVTERYQPEPDILVVGMNGDPYFITVELAGVDPIFDMAE